MEVWNYVQQFNKLIILNLPKNKELKLYLSFLNLNTLSLNLKISLLRLLLFWNCTGPLQTQNIGSHIYVDFGSNKLVGATANSGER